MRDSGVEKRFDTAAIITVGCRLNQAESDCLAGYLLARGLKVVRHPLPQANASTIRRVYINTCAVTQLAEENSLATIRRVCRLQPKPRVVVLGCLAERAPDLIRQIPGVDEIWSNQEKQDVIGGQSPVPSRSRALLKIQDGCDRHCSFCLVSYLRGKPVSLPLFQVQERFQCLRQAGYQEIVLTGLNLGRYESNGLDLARLLETLLKTPGDFRIRLSSLEPDLFNEPLLEVIAEPKVCAHFHIPLQSGDDRILQLMGRPYTVSSYDRLLAKILKIKPDACIGADVIVGFPGEDDNSFERTRLYLESSAVNYLHVFPYSVRVGTKAAQWGDPVTREKKGERVRVLRSLSEKRRRDYARRFCGDVRGVILEPRGKGLTDNYLRLTCLDLRGKEYQPGRLIALEIQLEGEKLIGKMPGWQEGS
ncbi:MAG: radical SAM protein [candidate division WOR-3 bacterium]